MSEHSKTDPISADEALEPVHNGQRLFLGSGAAEPGALVEALVRKGERLADMEVLHLLTLGQASYASGRFAGKLRHNALFIGPNVRSAVAQGLADYTPCFLSEVPGLIRSGRLPVDVALIQVTPPEKGVCSLGVSVDVIKAAVESAGYVVAQVNPRMPWTLGDSMIRVEDVDAFVPGEAALPELPAAEDTAVAAWIGRYVAALVEDGATLQIGIGAVPNAILAALAGKKDLGIHSEMISDGVLALIERGAITGARKSMDPGKVTASFCLGSRRLYGAVDRNPLFEFRPSDYVNHPVVIGRNEKMVAINSALQVDLTGQVAADSIGHRFYSGVGGQVDFIRGAALSRGGRSIIALPSTAKRGSVSRIVPFLTQGTGVVSTRADVDFVVTEYGIASLKGKTIRERAVALIQIAHPDQRSQLTAVAASYGLLDQGHLIPPAAEAYHVELETSRHFGSLEVKFRPLKPSDEKKLKQLFYSQSQETTYSRYGMYLKRLSERQFQELVAIDYRNSLAIAGFVREDERERMIAVARYYVEPGTRWAETAFTVLDAYQGLGIGTFLVDYLAWIGKSRGLEGFRAEIMNPTPKMVRILNRCFTRAVERDLGPDGRSFEARLEDWRGSGDPSAEPARAAVQGG